MIVNAVEVIRQTFQFVYVIGGLLRGCLYFIYIVGCLLHGYLYFFSV